MKPPRPLAITFRRGILSDPSKRGYILNSIHPHHPAIASRWGILEMRIKCSTQSITDSKPPRLWKLLIGNSKRY